MNSRQFAVLSIAVLIVLAVSPLKDYNQEWRKSQRKYYKAQAARATDPKEAQRLLNTRIEVKQIILQNGKDVDRCITCHLDLDALEASHPTADEFPFEDYGCTICHGGNGRATTKDEAHYTMWNRVPAQMAGRIQALRSRHWKERFHAVEELRDLTGQAFGYVYYDPEKEREEAVKKWEQWWKNNKDFFEVELRQKPKPLQESRIDPYAYSLSGRKLKYVGSEECLVCHEERHQERWQRTKFKTFDRIEEGLQKFDLMEIKPVEKKPAREECFPCHTTGYDPISNTYAEPGVTCEGCHGPGEVFFGLMAGGHASEGARIVRANLLRHAVADICARCHNPRRHDMLYGKE